MRTFRKTVAVDFDGVIHQYDGWRDGTAYGEPMSEAFYYLERLMDIGFVYIFSTRAPEQILEWMTRQGFKRPMQIIPYIDPAGEKRPFWNVPGVLGISNQKLGAAIYLDDRGYQFTAWSEDVIREIVKRI